jgi:ABC-2 type transport system ATP-binding protein
VDPLSRRNFWELIYVLAQQGTTVFVTTHYLEEAEYCDRLALMNRGKLIALDTPSAIRFSLKEPLLAIEASEPLRAVELLGREAAVQGAGLFGRNIHALAVDPVRAEAAIRKILGDAGIAVRSVERIPPSLEDVFVALIEKAGGAVDG